jgi:hypothetical protein
MQSGGRMSWLGNFLPFAKDSLGELKSHPWQAAGALLGVPGYDPAIGGLFNNKEGGALISPTGNFTSSAWQDMRNSNPGDAGALNQFHGMNAIADKVAPMIAAFYAAPAMGAAGGTSGGSGGGLGGLFGSGTTGGAGSGGGLMGMSEGVSGGGPLSGITAGMGGSSAMGPMGGPGQFAGSFSGMPYAFSMPDTGSLSAGSGSAMNPQMMQQAMQMLQQRNQQQQQQGQAPAPGAPMAFGNPHVSNGSIGQPTPYTTFGSAGGQSLSPLAQLLAMRGGM